MRRASWKKVVALTASQLGWQATFTPRAVTRYQLDTIQATCRPTWLDEGMAQRGPS